MTLSNTKLAWQVFRRNKSAMTGSLILLIIVLMSLVGPWFAPHDPAQQFSDKILTPPLWYDNGEFLTPLGTDDLGRDMLSRLLHGARLSLKLTIMVVFAAAFIGILIGAAAAFLN